MTDQHLCPTCGRRPSERHAECGTKSSAHGPYPDRCHAPIHDRADACEEMLALLRVFETNYAAPAWKQMELYGKRRALLSRFPEESE